MKYAILLLVTVACAHKPQKQPDPRPTPIVWNGSLTPINTQYQAIQNQIIQQQLEIDLQRSLIMNGLH